MTKPHVLSKAQLQEPMFVYLAASSKAVDVALIRENEGIQKPMYYVSQVLRMPRPDILI